MVSNHSQKRSTKTAPPVNGAKPGRPVISLTEGFATYRKLASDRLRRFDVPQAQRNLRALVRKNVVDPLREQADQATDPIMRCNWFALASCMEEECSLSLDSMFAQLEGQSVSAEISERREKLANQMAKLQKALVDGESVSMRW